MKREKFTIPNRMIDALNSPGSPFQNWLSEMAARLTVLIQTLSILAELLATRCPKCGDLATVGWIKVGDHSMCRRLDTDDGTISPF